MSTPLKKIYEHWTKEQWVRKEELKRLAAQNEADIKVFLNFQVKLDKSIENLSSLLEVNDKSVTRLKEIRERVPEMFKLTTELSESIDKQNALLEDMSDTRARILLEQMDVLSKAGEEGLGTMVSTENTPPFAIPAKKIQIDPNAMDFSGLPAKDTNTQGPTLNGEARDPSENLAGDATKNS
ncbi:hypothetical protein GGP41_009616 [Bipolaris sorokiniana]|uniref:Uncharacterized protein n=1 Tax=Cochliobolus sativus TaxID=45130 RepID=A0A8H6DRI0_COCSA|nr:hypothetical protein GGP41_009616 [Bipolaris sorokiniana]